MTPLYILLNPFNLIAFSFALDGRAIWGVSPDYKLDFSVLSLFKVFGIPTLIFMASWFLIRVLMRLSNWKLYILSTIFSVILIYVGSEIYWTVVGR